MTVQRLSGRDIDGLHDAQIRLDYVLSHLIESPSLLRRSVFVAQLWRLDELTSVGKFKGPVRLAAGAIFEISGRSSKEQGRHCAAVRHEAR